MGASVVYPVQVLREHLSGLEAAITVCLADPDHKPVHKLRTETRRVEALLALLALIPDLPDHQKEAEATQRALTKLRRAAGKVRDLDVHRKMLESFADEEDELGARPAEAKGKAHNANEGNGASAKPAKGKAAKAKSAGTDAGGASTAQDAALLSASAKELRDHLSQSRQKAAQELVALLRKRQVKTAKAAQELLQVLCAAEEVPLPGAELLKDAEGLLSRDGLLGKTPISDLGEDELHTIRKSAKRARYLAESLPEDEALTAAAGRFEAMQDAGGQWHDALEIARAARRFFGKGNELVAAYRQERDEKLEAYRALLAENTVKQKKNSPKAGSNGGSRKSQSRVNRPAARKGSKAA